MRSFVRSGRALPLFRMRFSLHTYGDCSRPKSCSASWAHVGKGSLMFGSNGWPVGYTDRVKSSYKRPWEIVATKVLCRLSTSSLRPAGKAIISFSHLWHAMRGGAASIQPKFKIKACSPCS